jgi:hypothetical protein
VEKLKPEPEVSEKIATTRVKIIARYIRYFITLVRYC